MGSPEGNECVRVAVPAVFGREAFRIEALWVGEVTRVAMCPQRQYRHVAARGDGLARTQVHILRGLQSMNEQSTEHEHTVRYTVEMRKMEATDYASKYRHRREEAQRFLEGALQVHHVLQVRGQNVAVLIRPEEVVQLLKHRVPSCISSIPDFTWFFSHGKKLLRL